MKVQQCKRCGKRNAPLKKICTECGAFLEGHTINNVTGQYGYRHADGTFTPDKNIHAADLGVLIDDKEKAKWPNEI